MTPEQFAEGMTYEDFKNQMTRNQERFAANERQFQIDPADFAAFADLPEPLPVMVLAEDWCGDVIDNLPVLGRIAEQSGKLKVRIFLRDQNLELMDQYLNQGQFRSIPVFAIFDGSWAEKGRFIERPQAVTDRRRRLREELFAKHPEFGSPDTPISQLPEDIRNQIVEANSTWREEWKAEDNKEVVRALVEIVKSASPSDGSSKPE
ncbi:MAG: thioredoxin family protein [Chloroflexi bacterium]|nr:MAG: thioredoxin family protein [Chloroflexota bacterium]